MPINDVNSPALLSAPGKSLAPANGKREELEMRRVAQEFEALLLTQLTASLGPKLDDDEEGSLMRSDATDMYQKMFGEQMAQTMAKQGGIGLTDFMLQHMRAKGDAAPETQQNLANVTARAIETARSLRGEASTAVTMPAIQPGANLNATPAAANASSPEIVRPALTPSSSSATRPRRVFPIVDAAPQAHHDEHHLHQLPVDGRISSNFGLRRDPVTGNRRFHRGVDIAAPKGSPIGAFAEGTVVFAGRQGGYGQTVVIEHADGRQTRYAHAERLMVRTGDVVRAGETIATVGSTGRSTGPHLHFEVSEEGQRIDPLRALANENALARR